MSIPGHFIFSKKMAIKGAMDSNLQIILPAMFDDIDVNGGGFIVRKGEKGEKAGYCDQKGREIVPIQYDQSSWMPARRFLHGKGRTHRRTGH